MDQTDELHERALAYHRALPPRIRGYLNARGIPDGVIDLHRLGWNGERITIPIFDRDGKLAYFKLAKDPEDRSGTPKILLPPGARAELYGWERLRAKPCRIVICEGEFDRLVLEAQGFAAVSSTAGAAVFRQEWAEAFRAIPEVFVCFDCDEAGREGALRVARLIPGARIVTLPPEVGPGGDVTDFFVRLGRDREAFQQRLHAAQEAPDPPFSAENDPGPVRAPIRPDRAVSELKQAVAIETVVGRYLPLRRQGRVQVGRCPFHDDRHPSFVVYAASRRFVCFGCRASGDVLTFLMKVERLTFPEALDVLRELAA